MKRLILGFILVFFISPLAHAADAKGHCDEMIKHAQEAVDQGKAGDVKALTHHAEAMLEHAKGCEKESAAKDHVKEAMKHEEEAVDHGKAGHLDIALKHAEGALEHAKGAGQ
ncbi:MAG: small metal-binding protein SmbP [Nitrospiria bacterium]